MRRAALLLVVLAALAVGAWFVRGRLHASAQSTAASARGGGANGGASGPDARPVPVTVTAVQQRDVPIYLEGLGNVAAFYTVAVKPQVDGRLERVLFREGQAVHRGDVLAQIDPRAFVIQLHQADAILARDRAILHADRLALERDTLLRTQHFIAPQEYDNAAALVAQYEGTVLADQAAVDNARLLIDYARITAPIDGVTGVRQVDPGNIVHASDPNGLVVITQLDPIAVFFTLPEDDLPHVAQAMAAGTVSVDVFSRDGVTQLGHGELALIDNQINAATATVRLKAIFPNPSHLLWPNQFVKSRLLVATHPATLVIPAVAVQRGPQGTFVYVVGSDQRVAVRAIEIERLDGDLALLTRASTVASGEQVVTDGQSRLRPGARVSIRPSDGAGINASDGSAPGTAPGRRGRPRGDASRRDGGGGAP